MGQRGDWPAVSTAIPVATIEIGRDYVSNHRDSHALSAYLFVDGMLCCVKVWYPTKQIVLATPY